MNPSHPVGVFFETENIYTLDPDCKQNLSIHAMLADWESANKSRRMILSYDQRICTGQYPVLDLLGYRHTKEGELIIQPEEAKTVRFIFLAYIGGYDCDEIAEILTERERPTLRGRTDWNTSMVMNIMSNERRWGDLEARKTIVIDYVEHKSKKNEHDRVSAYGKLVSSISSRAFSTTIYESLHWKKEFSFKFRGITKERGMSKILVFSLDEPQIIVGKKYKNHPDVEKESNQPFGFVKYKTDTGQENKPENNAIVCAYPEEWMKRRIGINYFIREQRDSMINAITEEDIEETGVVVENPVIGHIPSRQEIVNELEELLMTM